MNKKQVAASPFEAGEVGWSPLISPQAREPYDPNITFEEYHYYAQKTREEELTLQSPVLNVRQMFKKKSEQEVPSNIPTLTEADFRNPERRLQITNEEWNNASRSFRSASWGACEY